MYENIPSLKIYLITYDTILTEHNNNDEVSDKSIPVF